MKNLFYFSRTGTNKEKKQGQCVTSGHAHAWRPAADHPIMLCFQIGT